MRKIRKGRRRAFRLAQYAYGGNVKKVIAFVHLYGKWFAVGDVQGARVNIQRRGTNKNDTPAPFIWSRGVLKVKPLRRN